MKAISNRSKKPGSTVRSQLRIATQEIHERLHSQMLFQRLQAGVISVADYRHLLLRLYGFHEPIERELLRYGGHWPDLQVCSRRRAHLLIDDLRAVGWSGIAAQIPLATAPRDLADPHRLIGCLYVREGATLGGRVLAGRLDHLFGGDTHGRTFFTGSDRDPGLWRSLCVALEGRASQRGLDAVITAARDTFDVFERWINETEFSVTEKV